MKLKALLVLLCLFPCLYVSAQSIKVTGSVTDATNNETLIGVNIKAKNSDAATQTDVNGNYSITVPANETIVFT